MKKLIVFCMIALGFTIGASAQQTALTADGKVVILYDNGTWTYADVNVPAQNSKTQDSEITTSKILMKVSDNKVNNAPVHIKDGIVEKSVFIEGPSKKLAKYFKEKNIVRCNFTLSAKDGKATLTTDWKIMNGEAYSYFGFIKAGNKLTLELVGGKTVDLVYNEEFEPKEYPKYGFSTYQAELELSEDQIKVLRNGIILKAYMHWARRMEEYKVVSPSYFVKAIPQITEN